MQRRPTPPDPVIRIFKAASRSREAAGFLAAPAHNRAPTKMASQAMEAPPNAASTLMPPESKPQPNASMPRHLPPSSSAAIFCPRRSPESPATRLQPISCFAIKVALAHEIARRARKRPPMRMNAVRTAQAAEPVADQLLVPASFPAAPTMKSGSAIAGPSAT